MLELRHGANEAPIRLMRAACLGLALLSAACTTAAPLPMSTVKNLRAIEGSWNCTQSTLTIDVRIIGMRINALDDRTAIMTLVYQAARGR